MTISEIIDDWAKGLAAIPEFVSESSLRVLKKMLEVHEENVKFYNEFPTFHD